MYEEYIESKFVETQYKGYLINKYGIMKSRNGVLLRPSKSLSYIIKIDNNSIYISAKKEVKMCFGTSEYILNKDFITEIVDDYNEDFIDESEDEFDLFYHKCKTCDAIISKSQTWCAECKEKRKNSLNGYSGCRTSINSSDFLVG
jgi:hypothetical protein